MAKNTVEIIISATDKASGTLKGVGGSLKSLGKIAAVGVGAAAAGTVALGGALVKLAVDAAPLEGIGKAFEGLTANMEGGSSVMLAALEKGSAGMIAQSELMRNFNQAAQLVSLDFAKQLPDAMEYLGKVSAATGQDMGYLLESLTTGVGRLSPMILDNLAIQVDMAAANEAYAKSLGKTASELTKSEKQTALMDQVLAKLAENTADMPAVTGSATQQMAKLGATLKNTKDTIGKAVLPAFTGLLTKVSEMAERYLPILMDAFETHVAPFLRDDLLPLLERLWEWFGSLLPGAVEIFKNTIWPIVSIFSPLGLIIRALRGDFDEFFASVTPAFQALVDTIKTTVPQIVETLSAVAGAIMSVVGPVVSELVTFIQEMFGIVITWVQENWPLIQEAISDTLGTIQTIVSTVLTAILTFWQNHGAAIMDFVRTVWNMVKTIIETAIRAVLGVIRAVLFIISGDWESAWTTLKETLGVIWDGIKAVVTEGGQKLWEIVGLAVSKLPGIIKSIGNKMLAAGKAIIEKLWEGLKSKLGEVKEWFGQQLDKFTDLLPFSEPKDPASPLRGLSKAGEMIGTNLLQGLQASMPRLQTELAGGLARMVGAGAVGGGNTTHFNETHTYNVYDQATWAVIEQQRQMERDRRIQGRV